MAWIEIPEFDNMCCDKCGLVFGMRLYPRNFCPFCGKRHGGDDNEIQEWIEKERIRRSFWANMEGLTNEKTSIRRSFWADMEGLTNEKTNRQQSGKDT